MFSFPVFLQMNEIFGLFPVATQYNYANWKQHPNSIYEMTLTTRVKYSGTICILWSDLKYFDSLKYT